MQAVKRNQLLGETPIKNLLPKLALPGMIAMIVNALYNMVDTIFIGRFVGTDAIGGLAVSFPLQMLVGALAQLFGVGAAAVISRKLGEGKDDEAAAAAGNTMVSTLILGLVILGVGWFTVTPLLALFGATENLLIHARQYVTVLLFGVPFITFAMASNNIVRAEGQAKIAMMTMVIGTGMNLILDPIFIALLGWGIQGAAIATVISQGLSFLFLAVFLFSGKSSLDIRRRHFFPKPLILGEILSLGFPAFIRQGGMSLLAVVVNNALGHYGGDIYISAYGIVNRLLMFLLMPLFGMVQGFQPIAGYNYGARRMDRLKEVLGLSLKVSTLYGLVVFLLLEAFPRIFAGIFTPDPELISVSAQFLRIALIFIPLLGIQVMGASFFQAIGKAWPALFLGLSRQILFLIPLVLGLSALFGVKGIMAAFPGADLLATLVTGTWLLVELRHLGILRKKEPSLP